MNRFFGGGEPLIINIIIIKEPSVPTSWHFNNPALKFFVVSPLSAGYSPSVT